MPPDADLTWEAPEEALCITVVLARDEPTILAALGADPSTARSMTYLATLDEWSDDIATARVWRDGDAVVIVEPNGWELSIPETFLEIVGDAFAVTVFWNVNANMQVLVARGGAIVRSFDPLFYPDEPGEGEPLPEEAGLAFGEDHATSSALALFARLTGFRPTPEAVTGGERPTVTFERRRHPAVSETFR